MNTETKKEQQRKDRPRFPDKRLLPACFISLALSFLLLFYAPLEIYSNNYGEFWFSYSLLFKLMLPCFLCAFLALTGLAALVLHLGGKKLYTVYLAALTAALLSVYIQGTFFVGRLPAMDGNEIDWSQYAGQRRVSLVICALCLAAVILALRLLGRETWGAALCWIGGGMTLMLAVTLAVVSFSTGAYVTRSYVLTRDNQMELSEDKNYIILMVDAVDAEIFSRLLTDHPEYETGVLKDFTRYENVLSGYHITQYSIPMFLSGGWYELAEPYEDYFSRSFESSAFLQELQREDYRMDMYSDTVPYDYYSKLSNTVESQEDLISPLGLIKKELRLVAFRYAPYQLKPFFWFDPLDFDTLRSSDHLTYISWTGNIDFDEAMDTLPVTLSKEKRFKFFHVDGAHNGSFNQRLENGKIVLEDPPSSAYDKTEVCLYLLEKYCSILKEQGVYDDSVIVLMSDHGQHLGTESLDENIWMLRRADPVFLVKGFDTEHPKMLTSDIPISYIELPGAFLKLLGGADGENLFDPRPDDVVRRYFITDTYNWEHLHEYAQVGSPSDLDSFTPTGKDYTR